MRCLEFCSALDYVAGVAGDDQLLVRGDDKELDLGVGGGDAHVFAALLVLLRIHLAAEEAEVLADARACGGAVLAHAGGEDDGVHAVHGGGVAAHDLGDPVVEHVEREPRALVALGGRGLEVAEVAGDARDAQHAGLLVEHVEHLVDVHAVLVHDELHDARVKVAAAGAHRQANQRGETHGGVHTLAAVDGADGRAVAHVAADYLKLLDGLAHQLGAAARDIAVAGAVETIAADTVVLVVVIGHCVGESLGRHGLMEGSVEHADLRHILAHDLDAGVDAGDVRGVVQRREGGAVFKRLHDLVRDAHGGSELLAAVDDPVADSVYLAHTGHDAVLGARKLVDDRGYGLGMGRQGNILVEHGLAADERGVFQMTVDAYPLAKALREHGLGLHINELVLEGGASGVDDQYFHFSSILSIVNVIRP